MATNAGRAGTERKEIRRVNQPGSEARQQDAGATCLDKGGH